ncbi:DUF4112 domain-containing protein [Alloalcanivorax mobilis]|uniref:DUF4112 domain-containing protein n=1 Tax=Alloalcanivorax mobilis TaxID=2019569 RepID=UPI000B5B42E1|nr:DUF4112 domain-containing protein [Alloalcanivorax mobilis]ASK35582.1 hypothetical protein CEK62_14945 [Alcanivorax sp. N3-2A]|tara:strand:- start:8793 stop:9260 length:468 start_codon:yes stop_codon:yes gene_type:complete
MAEHADTARDRARQEAALQRLERFSRFTDSSIGIPFTRFRLGAEAIIGLVPVVGDAAGLVLSSYVLLEAQRAGVPGALKRKMLRNMLVDFIGGLLPVVGDAFDAIYKANTRNTRLLREHLHRQLHEERKDPFPWATLAGLSVLFALITAAVVMVL